jgi:hypothetical protein
MRLDRTNQPKAQMANAYVDAEQWEIEDILGMSDANESLAVR